MLVTRNVSSKLTMMKPISSMQIWSAAPTPLTADFTVDVASVGKMVDDAVAGGIHGLFLCGTCGEGPWLPDRERVRLVSAAAARAHGRLKIAVQTTDNSKPRILENIRQAADAGADYAILAAPTVCINATPERMAGLFEETAEASPLPIGIYDLGRHRPISIPEDRLEEIYLFPNVHLVKDSSGSAQRREIALAAKRAKPELKLLNGDEFRCIEYLEAGYDGFMFGGAVAVTPQLNRIVMLFATGRLEEARAVEGQLRAALYGIYGGEKFASWLTGLKYYMVRRGLFSSVTSYLGYPLTDECRAFIENHHGPTGELVQVAPHIAEPVH